MKRIWLVLAGLSVGLLFGGNQTPHAEQDAIDLSQWMPPDVGVVGDDPFDRLVKYGHKLFTDTANEVGPSVPDPAKRIAGNNLACQNCHLRAGTQPYAMPLIGVWGQFPQYRAREGMVDTLEERINGCMQRSMNGRALSASEPRNESVFHMPRKPAHTDVTHFNGVTVVEQLQYHKVSPMSETRMSGHADAASADGAANVRATTVPASNDWWQQLDQRVYQCIKLRVEQWWESQKRVLIDAVGQMFGEHRASVRETITNLKERVIRLETTSNFEERFIRLAHEVKRGSEIPQGQLLEKIEALRRQLDDLKRVAAQPGPQGPPGKLPRVKEYVAECVHYEGDVVTHAGALWQARGDTVHAPPHSDWICLARAGRNGSDGRSPNSAAHTMRAKNTNGSTSSLSTALLLLLVAIIRARVPATAGSF